MPRIPLAALIAIVIPVARGDATCRADSGVTNGLVRAAAHAAVWAEPGILHCAGPAGCKVRWARIGANLYVADGGPDPTAFDADRQVLEVRLSGHPSIRHLYAPVRQGGPGWFSNFIAGVAREVEFGGPEIECVASLPPGDLARNSPRSAAENRRLATRVAGMIASELKGVFGGAKCRVHFYPPRRLELRALAVVECGKNALQYASIHLDESGDAVRLEAPFDNAWRMKHASIRRRLTGRAPWIAGVNL